MSDAWDAFIAALDPVELERERMRVHGDLRTERPGSAADRRMRAAHEWIIADRRNGGEQARAQERARKHNQWADEQIARQRQEELDRAIVRWARRQQEAAVNTAHTRGHAA